MYTKLSKNLIVKSAIYKSNNKKINKIKTQKNKIKTTTKIIKYVTNVSIVIFCVQ